MSPVNTASVRLTSHARGGGCACKIPAAELEALVSGLPTAASSSGSSAPVAVGLEHGDDATVVEMPGRPGHGLVLTTDFFTPVVDDPYDWGRIAAANALSDVYAMGGTPTAAVNLLAWPRTALPLELAARVLAGGAAVAAEASCVLAGGHSIDDEGPKYGLAVTGTVPLDRMLRLDTARPGLPLTLTKPLGVGVLNARHKATGETFPEAVASMTTLNRDASVAAIRAGAVAATDVTGFGLLGHLYKMCRAAGVGAVVDTAAVPFLEGAVESAEAGWMPGGSRRNLAWVAPALAAGRTSETMRLLLADAQTSGGLLVAGEVPGFPVIGSLVPSESSPSISLR